MPGKEEERGQSEGTEKRKFCMRVFRKLDGWIDDYENERDETWGSCPLIPYTIVPRSRERDKIEQCRVVGP